MWKIVLLFIFISLSFADEAEWQKFEFLDHIVKTDDSVIAELPLTKLDTETIEKIHVTMKSLSYIPYQFIEDFCENRAHEYSLILNSFGIKTAKIQVKNSNNRLLYPLNYSGEIADFFAGWRWHVATVVADLQGDLWIIDPPLSEKVLNLDEWLGALNTSKDQAIIEYFHPFQIYPDRVTKSTDSIMTTPIEMNQKRQELGDNEFWWLYDKGLL